MTEAGPAPPTGPSCETPRRVPGPVPRAGGTPWPPCRRCASDGREGRSLPKAGRTGTGLQGARQRSAPRQPAASQRALRQPCNPAMVRIPPLPLREISVTSLRAGMATIAPPGGRLPAPPPAFPLAAGLAGLQDGGQAAACRCNRAVGHESRRWQGHPCPGAGRDPRSGRTQPRVLCPPRAMPRDAACGRGGGARESAQEAEKGREASAHCDLGRVGRQVPSRRNLRPGAGTSRPGRRALPPWPKGTGPGAGRKPPGRPSGRAGGTAGPRCNGARREPARGQGGRR